MQRYRNLGGNSGVVAFEHSKNSIKVRFHDGSEYLYDIQSAGSGNILQMIALAERGWGLNSFISRHVKKGYAARLYG